MNYQSIYNQLISKYKDHSKVKFQTNGHHIIPKSFAKLDGIEDINGSWNIVHLPHREHFIAHLLLARIWRGHKVKGPKMARAFRQMANCGWYTSKNYAWIKLSYKLSDETKNKMSLIRRGKGPRSEETKRKISKAKIISDKTPRGIPRSEETKRKISESSKGKTFDKIKCPYCGKIGGCGNMKRYHYENCKEKNTVMPWCQLLFTGRESCGSSPGRSGTLHRAL